MTTPQPVQSSKQESGYGCLTRLSWMLFGNIALIASAISIAKHKGGFLSYADLVFWIIVGALIWVRYIDITKMGGLTASEKPASLADWRRYIQYLGIFALVLWGVVHTIAYFH